MTTPEEPPLPGLPAEGSAPDEDPGGGAAPVPGDPPATGRHTAESLPPDEPESETIPERAPPAVPPERLPDGRRLVALPEEARRRQSRRDFFLFGMGAAAAAAAFYAVLPDTTRERFLTDDERAFLDSLEGRVGLGEKQRENILKRALTFDDDVAEALYSPRRLVRTYRRSDVTPVPNNYAGETPDPDYIPDWELTVEGLANGKPATFSIGDLLARFRNRDQITRLCCVEGWSAIGWWGGFRFAELLDAYPPAPDARWAKLESSVNLDSDGDPDPYFVSVDLATARHPQTLLATHQNGQALSVEHGAPLRLLAPMKLGLKNIKAITRIVYSAAEPADYWNLQGYSKYDGL
jgi:DMSO/TMAO reductase YedYZ molybdopterin-dependent catalytic subunit